MGKCLKSNKQKGNDGFVLPYVLVVVFILALTSTIAVRSLNTSGRIITELNDDVLAEHRLVSAEAETLYVYLTSAPVKGGMDTSHTVWDGSDIIDGFDVSRLPVGALWAANGGKRTAQYPSGNVRVIYRDATGLIKLNSNSQDVLTELLLGFGLKTIDAKTATAKLGDYTDDNNRRRFRGAERASYRLKRLPPPSNAHLRTHEELYRILSWDDLITPQIYDRLRRYTTLTTSSTYYRTKFLSSEVVEILGLDEQDIAPLGLARRNVDIIDSITSTLETPTKLGRFIFSTQKKTGQTIIRAVELERSPSAADRPFKRHVVFEEIKNVGDSNSNERIEGEVSPPVFTTAYSLLQ